MHPAAKDMLIDGTEDKKTVEIRNYSLVVILTWNVRIPPSP